MKNFISLLKEHKKVIYLSFEIFWILFFVLDMIGNQSGGNIPQFIYVNF